MDTDTETSFPFVRNVRIAGFDESKGTKPLPFPTDYDEWLFVGQFKHDDLRQDCNFRCLMSALDEYFGRDCFRFTMIVGPDQKPWRSLLIVRNETGPAELARECMDTVDAGEHLNDAAYWRDANVYVQRMWTDLPMSERIGYVKETDTPPEAALEVEILELEYTSLWLRLYQEMDL
ncbi:MAG: hypothetical protein ACRYG8_44170 [Janthinobacterium lividum]